MTAITLRRVRIRLTGVVQGVGMRPFLSRLATELDLAGVVRNGPEGVTVEIEGTDTRVQRFVERLGREAPPLARLERMSMVDQAPTGAFGFRIEPTDRVGRALVAVPPDTAVCDDCVTELFDPDDRRYRHAFVSCTNCGPRFTIIDAAPYDRATTTMARFRMCAQCAQEYSDPSDRRFHAQPIACPDCGPRLRYVGGETAGGTDASIRAAQRALAAGSVVAVKGQGGYHLAVDARNDAAVQRLRDRKHRPDKPFAVMVRDLATAALLAELSEVEIDALQASSRPVVLVLSRPSASIAPSVSNGSPLTGILLPATPVHHLLFHDGGPDVLVMTSANAVGDPICHDDATVADRLRDIADAFLTHDLVIRFPCDDSVVRVVAGRVLPIRRSRGYAPLAVRLPTNVAPVLAMGGDMKGACCIAEARQASLSQHLGNLEHVAAADAASDVASALSYLHGVDPEVVAIDRHPDYVSSRLGRARAGSRRVTTVQHHHAHLAALLAEHEVEVDASVIGMVFDGTGYGDDGTVWGGEILVGGIRHVERWGHLRPVPLPGGTAAIVHPWRAARAHLRHAGVEHPDDFLDPEAATARDRAVLDRMLDRSVGCVVSSSMGRLFDAVASILGLRHSISYEAQAAIDLEHLAERAKDGPELRFTFAARGEFDAGPVVAAVARLHRMGVDRADLALAFHRAVAGVVVDAALRIRTETRIGVVGLTGGVFQNALLSELAERNLTDVGFEVLVHQLVPPNDGGLALGQAVVAGLPPRIGVR